MTFHRKDLMLKKLLKKKMILPLLGIVMTTLFRHRLSFAIDIDQTQLIFNNIQVKAEVVFDPASRKFSYTYTITNPPTNTVMVGDIGIDIVHSRRKSVIRGKGSVSDKKLYEYDHAERISALAREGISVMKVDVINPPFKVSESMSQGEWGAFLSFGGKKHAGWIFWSAGEGYCDDRSAIAPGGTVKGFGLTGHGLPGIRQVNLSGSVPCRLMPEEGDSDAEISRIRTIWESLAFEANSIGPVPSPAVFKPTDFIAKLRGYMTEAQKLGWLSPEFAVTLVPNLDAVSTAVLLQDIETAKLQLKKFIKALPAPPSGTVACTSECSGLLAYNAQYLLDQLSKNTGQKK